eukprot:244728-Hanusia_phi.AAC.1
MSAHVRVFPRRKALQGALIFYKGSRGVSLDLSSFKDLFHLPQSKAAASLGLSLTAFKTARRRLGIARWPYERRASPSSKRGAAKATRGVSTTTGSEDRRQGQEEEDEEEAWRLDPAWIAWYMSASDDAGLS